MIEFNKKWCERQLMKRWGNKTIHAQDCVFQLMEDAYRLGQENTIRDDIEDHDALWEAADGYWHKELKEQKP